MMIIQGIKKIIKQNSLKESQMSYIVGSGMLTSDLGILEIPHISAPARLIDFLKNCKIIISEDFFQIPFILVPGMKNLTDVTDINIDTMDMLRGEEVETFGLLEQLKPTGKGLIILPGSHTKYLLIGENQTLLASYSTLGGEVLSAIRGNTILSNSIGKGLIEVIDKDQLLAGYQASESVGLTRCFYHIRLQHLFSNLDANERANYLVGAVLQSDLKALHSFLNNHQKLDWMIVGGSNPLREAFAYLLRKKYPNINIIEVTNEQVEYAYIYGAKKIGDKYLRNKKEHKRDEDR